ncbi:hypothetical protein [Streptobacillus canis]|uniref:hypothetical protein n=1 Tax=Streptobacillus canis TaxID=2678686 RepID=UPI0012E32A28|nr:hypothetical protein [Streptobacillus canis]
MKKYKVIAAGLIGINLFAMEGKIETGIEVAPIFSKRIGDNSKDIEGSPFRYERTKYTLKVADLNLDFKKQGLNFGAVLKSSRENSILNDWDYGVLSLETNKRMKNHDVMAKLYGSYQSPEFYGLNSKTELTYYVDDLISIRQINHDTGVVNDLERPAEYVEKIDNEVKRNALGNMVFKTSISGEVKESKTKLDTSVEYKANQFARFDKDESYFKTNLKVDQELGKLNLGFSHNLNYDLHFGSKPFNTFTTDLTVYPDFMAGNYVDRLIQDTNASISYDLDGYKLGSKLKVETDSFFVGGENKTQKVDTVYDEIKPNLNISVEKEIVEGLKIKPELVNTLEFRTARYSRVKVKDKWASYKPELNLGLEYNKKFGESNIENITKLGYGPKMTILPFITKGSHLLHETSLNNKLSGKYVLNKNTTINGKSNIDLKLSVLNKSLKPVDFKFDVEGDVEHKFNDKLSLIAKVSNKFTIKSQNKVLNPDNFTNIFNASLETKYKHIDKEKEKLSVNSKLSNDLTAVFDYYIEPEAKHAGRNSVEIEYKPQLAYLRGESLPTVLRNLISLNSNIEYEKELKENLRLKTGLEINTKLDLFALRSIKMYHYKNQDAELKENQEKPRLSDYRNTIFNLGGAIDLKPSISLEYDILKNLKLSAALDTTVLFEKKVFNKIVDNKRPDDGLYGPIDKKIEFKKLVPNVSLGLSYTW